MTVALDESYRPIPADTGRRQGEIQGTHTLTITPVGQALLTEPTKRKNTGRTRTHRKVLAGC